VPSGWNLTELTPLSWSTNVLMHCREEKSHSFTVWSSEPDAISLWSGAKVHERIQLLCALMENRNLRSAI
jgi:hypothetical protein